MTISSLRSLRCVMNRSGVAQVRQISVQAVKVETSDCVKTSDRQQQQQQTKYEEDFQNYLYLKSSLHEVYKIDLDARMGSVSSLVSSGLLPAREAPANLLAHCEDQLAMAGLPPPLRRNWNLVFPQHTSPELQQNTLRVFQWNILAQAIGTKIDKFVLADSRALDWASRRWRVVEEIIRHQPDLVCLQEVDHYPFISSALASSGYSGRFCPKPDSACYYVPDNSGPDGCAVLYREDKFSLLSVEKKVLTAWQSETNQVVLALVLQHRQTARQLCVVTTHLKARKGALLANIREQQGEDLMSWLEELSDGRSLILTGDFNAEPSEAVYQTITNNKELRLASAYDNTSLDYTSWKVRDTGEEKQVLDYIFHSPDLRTLRTLDVPSEEDLGEARLPSLAYASDHLSLLADISI